MSVKTDTDEDIFSDLPSLAGRYKRNANILFSSSIILLPLVVFLLITPNVVRLNGFQNIRALYYTPGLWELSGLDFWVRFLFETPFAIFRGFGGVVILIFIVMLIFLQLIITIKSWCFYKNILNDNTWVKKQK